MGLTIIAPDTGNPEDVLVRRIGEFIDVIVRADTKGHWESVARDWGLLDSAKRPTEGVSVDVVGPVEITPAVVDANGEVVTAAVYDARYHVNVRVRDTFDWEPFALKWTRDGQPAAANAEEEGRRFYRVTLIDPDTIKSPTRVWL